MKILLGIAAAPGLISGKVHQLSFSEVPKLIPRQIENVQEEISKLSSAIEATKADLLAEKDSMSAKLGEKELSIYDAHIGILEDVELVDQSIAKIEQEQCNCDYAYESVALDFQQMLLDLEDEYLRARSQDIKEVSARLVAHINNSSSSTAVFEAESILVCEHMTTHQLSMLDTSKIGGIITSGGGVTDHIAIIAKALGIPLVAGLKGNIKLLKTGDLLILNGNTGEVCCQPNAAEIEEYESDRRTDLAQKRKAIENSAQKAYTQTGKSIKVYANVADLSDVEKALENGAEGIGLMRTELTFSSTTQAPTEEEHYNFYRQVLEDMKGKETVIRLLDFGSDKKVPYLDQLGEENPALGLRALRLGFKYYDMLLAPQIRALLRLSKDFNLQILCPMIATVADIKQIKEAFDKESASLKNRETPFGTPSIGIMVEIPYVAFFPDLFVEEVDFFSFGTNDLSQFLVAADRTNSEVSAYLDQAKEGIVQLIRNTTRIAHDRDKWVGICGEMASDKSLLSEFIEMGVDEISMPPSLIPGVKEFIRTLA